MTAGLRAPGDRNKNAVFPDGRLIGTIGGGCMESRVMHQCLRILKEADPRPRLTEEILTGEEAGEEGLCLRRKDPGFPGGSLKRTGPGKSEEENKDETIRDQ